MQHNVMQRFIPFTCKADVSEPAGSAGGIWRLSNLVLMGLALFASRMGFVAIRALYSLPLLTLCLYVCTLVDFSGLLGSDTAQIWARVSNVLQFLWLHRDSCTAVDVQLTQHHAFAFAFHGTSRTGTAVLTGLDTCTLCGQVHEAASSKSLPLAPVAIVC